MSLPDSPGEWAAVIGLLLAVFGVERLALQLGWIKPEKDVNPGWAYLRWRLIAVPVVVGAFLAYHLLFDRG